MVQSLTDSSKTEIIKQSITIEGREHLAEDILNGLFGNNYNGPNKNEIEAFLLDWFNEKADISIFTSGSTGKPKPINVRKSQMIKSAAITCNFFNLTKGDKALLCMPLNFIAGKMMIVRAIVADLDLYIVEPSGHPLEKVYENFDFISMVPMQVYNSLQVFSEKVKLKNAKNLLIGGGSISNEIENELKDFPNKVFASYGMAETLTHIALRRVNGENPSQSYTPLPSVNVSLSEDNTLVIYAPLVNDEVLITNDIAEIKSDGSFIILGRKDNVIVSGGIKIQVEKLESILENFIKVPFAISSIPDPKFGEVVVLVIEKMIDTTILFDNLSPREKPKKVILTKKIPLTESGKVNRIELKKIINL